MFSALSSLPLFLRRNGEVHNLRSPENRTVSRVRQFQLPPSDLSCGDRENRRDVHVRTSWRIADCRLLQSPRWPTIQPLMSAITTSFSRSLSRSWKCPSYSFRVLSCEPTVS